MQKMRLLVVLAVTISMLSTGCLLEPASESSEHELSAARRRGQNIWFNNTYGGEQFFAFLAAHPDPAKRINVGFEKVLNTPRHLRFDVWGTINDPDCSADPNGGTDICSDPAATGVVGLRRGVGGLVGVACAGCHAGFDPLDLPDNLAEPTWDNVHPSIGNQHLKIGKMFAANLAPTDVRALMFAAWPDGTVDTTALFNDNIMNPIVMTAFWNHKYRPTFNVGLDEKKLRNGQGGEDDVGGDLAALRVYTNIGVCFFECVAPAVATDRPISIDACRAQCPDFPPQQDLDDMGEFLGSIRAPQYPDDDDSDSDANEHGQEVFEHNCASCHDNSRERRMALTNDEINPLAADPANATNACRALTTNWDNGKVWAEFSSDVLRARSPAGKGYRTVPLVGVWSTAPFLHNQSIGGWAAADATPEERAANYEDAMWELLQPVRSPKVNVLPFDVGPFPAGTPLTVVFSRDPSTGELLCGDHLENRGHHYGSELPDDDKAALIEWLKYQ